jgi:imidazolonepropionase-like amidohydrolase
MTGTRSRTLGTLWVLAAISAAGPAFAQDSESVTLFTNVNVFDGTSDALIANGNVLVEGNMITAVSADPIAADGATVIDGGGRTLMPGMIEAHGHVTYAAPLVAMLMQQDANEMAIRSARRAQDYLMAGFTTVRDMGGNAFGVQKALDAGLFPGPRIYPSGPPVSQTSGHGDFRTANDGNPYFDGRDLAGVADRHAWTRIADGADEVRRAVRDNLFRGAAQIKVYTSGGVTSFTDPLFAVQYTHEEIAAAVEEAKRYGTYVAVHAQTNDGVVAALDAGAISIEHGLILEEDTVKRMAEMGAYYNPQAFLALQDTSGNPMFQDPIQQEKLKAVQEGAPAGDAPGKTVWREDPVGHGRVLRRRCLPELPPGIRLSRRLLHPDRADAAGHRQQWRGACPVRLEEPVSAWRPRRDRGGRLCRHPPDRRRPDAGHPPADGLRQHRPDHEGRRDLQGRIVMNVPSRRPGAGVLMLLAAPILWLALALPAAAAPMATWASLAPSVEPYDDPFAEMPYEQIEALRTILRADMAAEAGQLDAAMAEAAADARRLVEEAGLDVEALFAQREIIMQRREEAELGVTTTHLDQTVVMDGYALPLRAEDGRIVEFLLVPWVGACIHTPPPSANQIVHVDYPQGFEAFSQFTPIRLEGRLRHRLAEHDLFLVDGTMPVATSYAMEEAVIGGTPGEIVAADTATDDLSWFAAAQARITDIFTTAMTNMEQGRSSARSALGC